jgi:hypothetical protein
MEGFSTAPSNWKGPSISGSPAEKAPNPFRLERRYILDKFKGYKELSGTGGQVRARKREEV